MSALVGGSSRSSSMLFVRSIPAVSLKEAFIYEVEYLYTDEQRHTKKAKVRVGCLSGLSPNDEFYLWGLLALTFQQPEPSTELYATPHYILKELACLRRVRRAERITTTSASLWHAWRT